MISSKYFGPYSKANICTIICLAQERTPFLRGTWHTTPAKEKRVLVQYLCISTSYIYIKQNPTCLDGDKL
jgi:hypothetical protein